MSTYWGYRCTKDGETSDTWFNHGEHILRSVVKCWPLICKLRDEDTTGYIEVGIMAHSHDEGEIWEFLQKHYDHGVELCNEYGRSEPIKEDVRTC